MTVPANPKVSITWAKSMGDIDRVQWDVLATPLDTPFLNWKWLRLLETSGSVGAGTGWAPLYLVLEQGRRLVGGAPLYAKWHCEGEFVFDHIWADLAARIGVPYFPKMLGMSPFTPVPGYAFLTAPDQDSQALANAMLGAVHRLCRKNGFSGLSFNFADTEWAGRMAELGFSVWEHQGFVWENQGYRSFDDFLATYRSGRRKSLRKERAHLARRGVEVEIVQGADITAEHMEIMFSLYEKTNMQFGVWGCMYLTREVFESMPEVFGENLMLVAARTPGSRRPVGMALFVRKGNRLFGRYWGCFEQIDFLHFELCYYTPIEWCIANNVSTFDPGMGGEHKARRGFRSVPSLSLHKFYEPGMDLILKAHIGEINTLEREHMAKLNALLPFADRPSAFR